MAAKVVMVAVPTVIGIASIRVYTVSEVPTDGVVTREKLNIYTPLPQSAQAQFVPERPGVIQSGFTKARHTVLPFFLAMKGACVSVKTTSVNLYYAGEDVYYYLKDPPPGFLPRFGTITMSGLLGMFLARKGSQFRRLAVPLGLMSATASVCYPAQTVAVLKVTGKKVYAVGQWSSATVSSLLASRSQEAATKEHAASQPQTAAVPNPESVVSEEASSAQSSTVPETQCDEPAVMTKEAEISTNQTSTETSTVAHSVPVETEAASASPSEEVQVPAQSAEPSDMKQAAEDVPADARSVESTPSVDPETVEASLVEAALASVDLPAPSPVEADPAPVEADPAPLEASPLEASPVEAVMVEAAMVEAAMVEAAMVEASPVEAALASAGPPAPEASHEPAVAGSAEPEPAPQPDRADPLQDAAIKETLMPPPLQQPVAQNSKEGSAFKADPALMDFGQSSPEDEDLYSTRS